MDVVFPDKPYTFLKAVEFFGEFEDAITVLSDMKNDMKEFIQFVEESGCESISAITSSLQKIADDLYSVWFSCRVADSFLRTWGPK